MSQFESDWRAWLAEGSTFLVQKPRLEKIVPSWNKYQELSLPYLLPPHLPSFILPFISSLLIKPSLLASICSNMAL